MQKSTVFKTSVMVKCGLFVALSIVLTRVFSVNLTPHLRVGIGQVPIMLSGFLFGPIAGGLVGGIADLVGVSLVPNGTPHLGFTFSSMLTGIFPGIFMMRLRYAQTKREEIIYIIIASALVMLIPHIILNTFWLTQLLGKGFVVLLPLRALKCVIEFVVNVFIITALYKVLKQFS